MNTLKRHWISISLSIVIIILCFMNTAPLPKVQVKDFDKLVHFLMFLAMSGAVYFENTRYFRFSTSFRRIFLGSFIFPVFFSGAIELVQEYLSPFRTGDWMDFLFDGMGALVGLIICLIINRKL